MPNQAHYNELPLRKVVTADDSPLVVLTTAAGAITRQTNAVELPPGVEDVEVGFILTDTANDTATVQLYGWTESSNPPVYPIGSWSLIAGTMVATTSPWGEAIASGLYVDTITEVGDYWGVNLRDNTGGNRIARIAFYARGLRYLYAEFTDVNDGGVEAASAQAFFRVY